MKFVPTQSDICGFEVIQRAQFFWFFDRGGVVIYCERRIVGMETVCFAGKIFYISINNLYLVFEEDYYA